MGAGAPQPGHAARGEPAAPPRARLRGRRGQRASSRCRSRRQALELAEIDEKGLDEQDREFLRTIIDVYDGGPVGIEAVAATMGEERDTLEDVIEPYLLQNAFVTRTRQGRRATKKAYEHLGSRGIRRATMATTPLPCSTTRPNPADSAARVFNS